jgi:tetratricopeptide (TPR) repeat protein
MQQTPTETKTPLEQAHALFNEKKYREVIPLYQKILQSNFDNFLVWANLGISLRYLGHYDAAAACLKRADELNPNISSILRHYAYCLMFLNRKYESLNAFETAVRLSPKDFYAHFVYAAALFQFDKNEEASVQYDIAHTLEPNNLEAILFRALIQLRLGKFREGWDAFNLRWRLANDQGLSNLIDQEKAFVSRRWTGEDLNGKSIHIYGEQGFGDTIMCSRYIPMVKSRGARTIVRCQKELLRLFQAIPSIDKLVESIHPEEKIDYHIPLMNLPGIFGTELDSIPPTAPLSAPEAIPTEAARLLALAQDRFKVGIVWSGNPNFADNARRAVHLSRFLPLAEVRGVQLYSLQKGSSEQELADCGAQSVVLALGPYMNDFADTAAVLKKLDLVIMTDSSVAHLAGSLSVPVWNLLSTGSYWVYLTDREDSPWYPSMRLFRQPEPGNWNSVFKRVAVELEKAVLLKRSRK